MHGREADIARDVDEADRLRIVRVNVIQCALEPPSLQLPSACRRIGSAGEGSQDDARHDRECQGFDKKLSVGCFTIFRVDERMAQPFNGGIDKNAGSGALVRPEG